MTIGAGMLLVTVGALLRYAVTAHVQGIDLKTVGTILIVIGIVGVVIGVYMMFTSRRAGAGPSSGSGPPYG